jgi:putative pyruvate formate lyase activating enzyme
VETVRALAERVSVFLPDMKYALPGPAERYSRARDYPETAAAAIREMVRLAGPWETDGDGLLRRGVLIRHLVLPGQGENTRRVIRWVADAFAPGEVLFSLMAQYTPCGELDAFPELRRTLTAEEWDEALAALEESGIEDGYVQDRSAAGEEEIPAFDGTGVVPGAEV